MWRGPEYPGDFPSLGWLAADWAERHCVIPDGVRVGQPFILTDEQLTFFVRHYRLKLDAKAGQTAQAFVYRRSQLVRPQKWGKSPFCACHICVEAVGPALFDGWAKRGEVYECDAFGCPCGWVREYEVGEPKGVPWPTPLIQITAYSEDQTDNIYDALLPMIRRGLLQYTIPKAGEGFTRLPGGGRIDTVTSSAKSRIGQRVTFVPQDETGLWTPTSGMVSVAENQRRGLAGMGGRSVEHTNAYDPAENSVAQQTVEAVAKGVTDIYIDHRLAPPQLSYRNKVERRRIHKHVYGDSLGWVDLDDIEGQAFELITKGDVAQAERFFGNRVLAGADAFLEDVRFWDRLTKPQLVTTGARVTLGFDGSMYDDWTAIRARLFGEDGRLYAFTPTFPDGKPMIWAPEEHGGEVPRAEVNAAVDYLFDVLDVVRMYCDPALYQSEIDAWSAEYGEKRVIAWPTNRISQMGALLERWHTDVKTQAFDHDGCPITQTHVRNARRVRRGQHVVVGKPAEHQKIDAFVADGLAHEAANDVIAAGLDREPVYESFAW